MEHLVLIGARIGAGQDVLFVESLQIKVVDIVDGLASQKPQEYDNSFFVGIYLTLAVALVAHPILKSYDLDGLRRF